VIRSAWLVHPGLIGLTVAAVFFACGTDDRSSPDPDKVPITNVCSKTVKTRALEKEDMAAKKLAANTLSLTFDSGPSEQTAEIEQFLAQQQVRATFFINGGNVDAASTTLDQMVTDGHLLANRTQTDDDVTKLATDALVKSVTDTDTIIGKKNKAGAKLFLRPPYGSWNDASQAALAASPMSKYTGPIGWDMGDNLAADIGSDSECWDKGKTGADCAALFLTQIRTTKTGIVLLHDGPPGISANVVDMVRTMVTTLKSEGFKFARLDELDLVPRSQLVPGDDPGDTDGGTDPVTGATSTSSGDDPCKTQ
jgi:peptidoglycan/xylan/chitin deacetylase (PgdA/CDA1 family)